MIRIKTVQTKISIEVTKIKIEVTKIKIAVIKIKTENHHLQKTINPVIVPVTKIRIKNINLVVVMIKIVISPHHLKMQIKIKTVINRQKTKIEPKVVLLVINTIHLHPEIKKKIEVIEKIDIETKNVTNIDLIKTSLEVMKMEIVKSIENQNMEKKWKLR